MIKPLPQRADRLRSIVAVSARSLAAIRVLERVAKLGHTLLDANGHGQMYHCREARPTRAPRAPPEQGRGGRGGVRCTRGPIEPRKGAAMLDLGTSFLASVARDPEALAIVDGDVRLSYSAWYGKISGLVASLDALGLKAGDRLVTVLQNRWEAATIHWACQFA